jgi:hypothetical protein
MAVNLNEFDVLKRNLPLKEHLPKYLCVKTKINTFDDYEFRLELGLDKTVRKFSHAGWTEMKPLVVGIKCYTRDGKNAFVYVRHCDRKKESCQLIDTFDVKNEEWHQFKFPLMANYHTDTRILMSEEVSAYTLAILDVSTRIREDHDTNYFPQGYASFDNTTYGSFNKPLIYTEFDKLINPSGASTANAIVVEAITQ